VFFVIGVLRLFFRTVQEKDGGIFAALLVLLLFFVLSNVSLAQNYIMSVISEAEDGMDIANPLATWIIIMIEKGLKIKECNDFVG
jgi:hypothetical protein